MRVSYLEVYNETVRDLLRGDGDEPDVYQTRWGGSRSKPQRAAPEVRLVDDARRGLTHVRGCVEAVVASVGDVFDAVADGERRRAFGETEFNDRSSRSHAILRLTVESSPRRRSSSRGPTSPPKILQSTLSFVDLAGSERCGEVSDAARQAEGAARRAG